MFPRVNPEVRFLDGGHIITDQMQQFSLFVTALLLTCTYKMGRRPNRPKKSWIRVAHMLLSSQNPPILLVSSS
jgi:hypothetical protein